MSDNKILLDETYKQAKARLEGAGYVVSESKAIDYGLQFSVSKANWKSILRLYCNKKAQLKYDYSQIKEDVLRQELNRVIEGVEDISYTSDNPNLNDEVSEMPFIPIIGTDESGKGDYFGPLVVAGVFVSEDTRPMLQKLGVRDSKKITDARIVEIAESIKKICYNNYAIIEISPETYNGLYDSFKKEGKNLNTLLAWGHAKAIEEVLGKVDCENALSDKFADEKFILSKLQEKGKRINLRQEHKAESNIAVAAASVLARARFLEKLKKLSQEYAVPLAKGASGLVIEQAKKIAHDNGVGALKKIAKLHFKTTEAITNQVNE